MSRVTSFGADHGIGRKDLLLDGGAGRIAGLNAAGEKIVQFAQAGDRSVEDGHIGPQSDRHLCGFLADNAAADDHHLAAGHAGNAAEQDPAAAMRLFQRVGCRLDRQPPRYFRHRRQQRQTATTICHRFVGDGGDAGGDQTLGLLRVRGEVQIGVEDLPLA
jgi:hypothetical protein